MRDALKALALRFGLSPAASLLPVIVWAAALVGAVRTALLELQATLRLLVLIGVVTSSVLLAVAVIGVLAG